jgi:glycosyltransferase involved in cell wall biosynthesis
MTGRYSESELRDLIAAESPDVLWFPQTWPETYSYTLSAAIESGLPIVASGLGALPERLAGRPQTWIMEDPSCPAAHWLALFNVVSESLRLGTGLALTHPPRHINIPFYPEAYLAFGAEGQRQRSDLVIDLRETGRLSILMLPDRFRDGRISPCGYIRILQPLDHMAVADESTCLHEVDVRAALLRVADILVCQRHAVPDVATAERLIRHCRKTGMRLIYDLDDDLISDAPEHPENSFIQTLVPVVIRFLLAADVVWVTTPELLRRLEAIRPDSVVLPNFLDERLWVQPNDSVPCLNDGIIRILYMGTATHDIDYAFMESVVERIERKFGAKVSFEIIGVTERKDLHFAVRRIEPPTSALASYPAFVSWFVHQLRWDICIAPLIDTRFSRAKSNIKLLDYAALGLPIIASDVPPYRGTLQKASGVRLVENDAAAWEEALSELIENAQARRELGRRCRAAFLREHSLAAAQERRHDALHLVDKMFWQGSARHLDFRAKKSEERIEINRQTFAESFLVGHGIEVGALHNPLRTPEHVKVRYVDRYDRDRLYKHYPELKDFNLVPVDIVDDGEKLSALAGASQDFIIANHFLEHCEDPLGTLANHLRVVRVDGVIYMAVPDKTHTFDKDRDITTLDHLVRDHEKGALVSRYQHYREWVVHVEPHFGRYGAGTPSDIIEARVAELMAQSYSIHFHCWTVVEVLEMLNHARGTMKLPFDIEFVAERDNEIIFVLRRTAGDAPQAMIPTRGG